MTTMSEHHSRRVFHWRSRHRRRFAPFLGVLLILFFLLLIYWAAVGACSTG